MRHECRKLGDGRQVVLCETKRRVTPFGGLVVLIELMRRIGLMEAVRARLPFAYRSNNASRPEHILLAFWLAVAAGARRFSHLQWLRGDEALRDLCGVRAFPTDDTVRNFFRRFGAAQISAFFRPLWQWFFTLLPARACVLDLDSTLLQRFGHQEGARTGHNPVRRNGRTHRPLLAFVTAPVLVLHAWLRAGHAADNRGAIEFLTEALTLLPADWTISGVRADSGFFDQKLLQFLEARRLPYILVARQHANVLAPAQALEAWTRLDAKTEVAEFTTQLPTWDRPRRFIVVRFPAAAAKEPTLFPLPRYEHRVFVTNRSESAAWLWRHYDQRAAIEPRFSELKRDLGADDFCLQRFFPTEAAFLSVLWVFNLLSLLQTLTSHARAQLRPATLRQSLFTCGAVAGRSGHKFVLFLSAAWGGLRLRKPLLDAINRAAFPTSPKLNPLAAPAPP